MITFLVLSLSSHLSKKEFDQKSHEFLSNSPQQRIVSSKIFDSSWMITFDPSDYIQSCVVYPALDMIPVHRRGHVASRMAGVEWVYDDEWLLHCSAIFKLPSLVDNNSSRYRNRVDFGHNRGRDRKRSTSPLGIATTAF